jgi:cytochrome b involved in lipid metabolism
MRRLLVYLSDISAAWSIIYTLSEITPVKLKHILSGLMVVLVMVGVGWLYMTGPKKASATASVTTPDPVASGSTANKSYGPAEVAQHASASSCWMIIDSKVYDVTKFIPEHPGGSQMLQGCGKDATSLFNGDTSNHDHSNSARSQLEGYYIGELKA